MSFKTLKAIGVRSNNSNFFKKRCRVDVILEPKEFSRKRKLKYRSSIIGEINGRSGNYNRGGSVGVKLMTAYKESSIKIAKLLIKEGPKTSSQLIKLGTSPKTYSILYKNYYGWFVKSEARGVYDISSKGRLTLEEYESYLT
ncbi:hypothetical protein EW093_08235 [Thiospirochaeta perfilievii]|uniref:Uncharacterized protein n=1 Tax=Thiospirochaeta perfilievii TaxID=252967 RepID=A0A5C1QDA1_9SPIO|nr:hypothetical protein EW093_08235 [Thiospirochaeta perfilievii]